MDDINRAWYARPQAIASFARDDRLEPALALLFVRFRDDILGRDVLDLGVGAGRTTRYLTALTTRYVGVDYSPSMVSFCASRFPNARVELGDASDLSSFAPSSFDFVLFSYAGIDALAHESRLQTLREVGRVLRPGGLFAFSAHNRDYRAARTTPRLQWSRNPITLLANVWRWVRQLRNHARVRRLEVESPEYALINDLAEEYSLIHYYISAAPQRAQLEQAGYEVIAVQDDNGADVSPDAVAREAPWLWYLARRPLR